MKTIKLAMIQMGNHYTDQALGYREASALITQAASEGAEIALLPELSGCGYIPNQSIWKYAERENGRTAKWASELSAQLGIYIGAGFIETDGKDFYNSYLLSSPRGKICGIIRKEDAESFCFKRGTYDTFIDTDIGRIGIGICADNHNIGRLLRMKDANIDLMLMPHASPSPYKRDKGISKEDLERIEKQAFVVAASYSNYLGVPAVFVNSVGSFPEMSGGFLVKSLNENFRIQGGSLITDARGKIIAKMDQNVGYSITTITLEKNSELPVVMPPVYHGTWLHPGSALFRNIILPHLVRKGVRSYNKERVKYIKSLRACRQ